jgi:hypothetical protein
MRRFVFLAAITIASLGIAGACNAQVKLPPQEVKGPEFDGVGQGTAKISKSGDAFFVSCAFVAGIPGDAEKTITVPLMFVVKTNESRQMPPNDGPVTRSFAQTFDVVQDPRNVFDKNSDVTLLDRRPAYMLLEWKDAPNRDATLLLPYAGVVSGPHRVAGLMGHGRMEPSLDPKDWKIIPGGTLRDVMQAKCNVYETTRGSVAMGVPK